MPNITVYADNETYIKFLKLKEGERKDLRNLIKEEISRRSKK